MKESINYTNQHEFWNDLKSGKFASMLKETAKGKMLSSANETYNVLKTYQ